MTSSDADHDPADDVIRGSLRQLPNPATPENAARRVHGRLRGRRIVRTLLAIAPVVLLAFGLLLCRPWSANEKTPTPPEMAQGNAKPLEQDEIQELFAAPPVDSLAILARRDQASVAALNGLEGNK